MHGRQQKKQKGKKAAEGSRRKWKEVEGSGGKWNCGLRRKQKEAEEAGASRRKQRKQEEAGGSRRKQKEAGGSNHMMKHDQAQATRCRDAFEITIRGGHGGSHEITGDHRSLRHP